MKAFDNLPVQFDSLQPVTTEQTHAFALYYKNWKCDCLCVVFNLDFALPMTSNECEYTK